MFNRLKRRSTLIIFFFIQFILLSSYTVLRYQEKESNEQRIESTTTAAARPDDLPASLIEKSDRSALKKNYKHLELRSAQSDDDRLNNEKLQLLNVSFVKDTDPQQTVIKCPLLPANLGNLSKLFVSSSMEDLFPGFSGSGRSGFILLRNRRNRRASREYKYPTRWPLVSFELYSSISSRDYHSLS